MEIEIKITKKDDATEPSWEILRFKDPDIETLKILNFVVGIIRSIKGVEIEKKIRIE